MSWSADCFPESFGQDIADWLRAVAMDHDEDLTPAERCELVDIALAVEQRAFRKMR